MRTCLFFSPQDLLNVVRPTGLISPDQILDAIKAKNESRDMDLQYRGYLSKCGLVVISVRFIYAKVFFFFSFFPPPIIIIIIIIQRHLVMFL